MHFAAESHVDRSITAPDAFVDDQRGRHARAAEGRAQVWLDERQWRRVRFHHVSTDEVYGSLGPDEPAFRETTPLRAQLAVRREQGGLGPPGARVRHTYGLPVITSNCSNNYGPYQFPEKLIPLMMVNALEGRALPVYGDGLNVRDWLYVEDHCRAHRAGPAERGGPARHTTSAAATSGGTSTSVRLLCRLVDETFAADPALSGAVPRNAPAARGPRDRLAGRRSSATGPGTTGATRSTRARSSASWVSPRPRARAGLRKTLGWYVANEAWWRGVMDGSYREWVARWYGGREAGGRAGER